MFASLGLNRIHPGSAPSRDQDPGFSGKTLADRSRQLIAALFGVPSLSTSRVSRALKVPSASGAVAKPRKIIWVRPEDIVFKVCREHKLRANDILAGDWDLDRARVADTKKYRSICQHFQEGHRWEDTILFETYAERLLAGESVRGLDSIPGLLRFYETQVEALFNDLSANGFRIERGLLGQPVSLPHVHIGRGGEVMYGNRGNHRLAMAKILSIEVMPCHVRTRHAEWQKIRDAIRADITLAEDGAEPSKIHRKFIGHPDLNDLFYPSR
jgi:hypothetical protein